MSQQSWAEIAEEEENIRIAEQSNNLGFMIVSDLVPDQNEQASPIRAIPVHRKFHSNNKVNQFEASAIPKNNRKIKDHEPREWTEEEIKKEIEKVKSKMEKGKICMHGCKCIKKDSSECTRFHYSKARFNGDACPFGVHCYKKGKDCPNIHPEPKPREIVPSNDSSEPQKSEGTSEDTITSGSGLEGTSSTPNPSPKPTIPPKPSVIASPNFHSKPHKFEGKKTSVGSKTVNRKPKENKKDFSGTVTPVFSEEQKPLVPQVNKLEKTEDSTPSVPSNSTCVTDGLGSPDTTDAAGNLDGFMSKLGVTTNSNGSVVISSHALLCFCGILFIAFIIFALK